MEGRQSAKAKTLIHSATVIQVIPTLIKLVVHSCV